MTITYMYNTKPHLPWGAWIEDLRKDAEVPSMADHDDHTRWLTELQDQFDQRKGWMDRLETSIAGHAGKLQHVEALVDRMPQLLRDSLCETLIKEFGDKFEVLEKQVRILLEERNQMAAQLTEVQRQRDEVQRQLDTLKGFFEKSALATGKKM